MAKTRKLSDSKLTDRTPTEWEQVVRRKLQNLIKDEMVTDVDCGFMEYKLRPGTQMTFVLEIIIRDANDKEHFVVVDEKRYFGPLRGIETKMKPGFNSSAFEVCIGHLLKPPESDGALTEKESRRMLFRR